MSLCCTPETNTGLANQLYFSKKREHCSQEIHVYFNGTTKLVPWSAPLGDKGAKINRNQNNVYLRGRGAVIQVGHK